MNETEELQAKIIRQEKEIDILRNEISILHWQINLLNEQLEKLKEVRSEN